MARLGDICEILDSKRIPITASNRKAGIYPYYGANGIQDYVDDYIFDDELVLFEAVIGILFESNISQTSPNLAITASPPTLSAPLESSLQAR